MAPRGLIPAPKFFTRNPTNFRCIRYGRQVSLILHTGILSPLSATFLEFPTLASSSPPSSVVPSNECESQNVCVHLWLKLPRPRLNPVGFRCQSSFSGNPNYSAPSTPMVCVCVAPSVVGPSVSSGSGNLRRAPRERSGHTPALNLAPAPTPRLIPGGHVPKDKTDHELDLGDTAARTTNTNVGEFRGRGPCAPVVGAYSAHPTATQATLPIRCAHSISGHLVAAH